MGSRALYNRVQFRRSGWTFRGLSSNSDDTKDAVDDLNHLAKVRVAGSNPVFRSRDGVL